MLEKNYSKSTTWDVVGNVGRFIKGVVMVFVSDKKWEKSKTIILRITIELGEGVGLNHKQ